MDLKERLTIAQEILLYTDEGRTLTPYELTLLEDGIQDFLDAEGQRQYRALHRRFIGKR